MIRKQKNLYAEKKLKNTSFLKLKLKNLKFSNCILEKVNFWESNIKDSFFENSIIKNSVFTDAFLLNSQFKNTIIQNTNLTHSNLRGVDFSTAQLKNINLRDAIYDKTTKWPKGFDPIKYGAIEIKNFNPFSYKRKLSFNTIKNLSSKEIDFYQKKIQNKKKFITYNKLEKKIIHELTKGKGYIIVKNFYKKNLINQAEKIIDSKLKKHKNYKKATSKYEVDKILKSINFFDLLNINDIFRKMIQPKVAMNAFRKLLGENFVCTYYSAQCSIAGSRGQSLHLDYPYVSYNKPGDIIPIGMGSENFLLSCGILTYLNDSAKDSYGPIYLEKSQKLRKFPTISDVKKLKFKSLKVPKGGMVILNTLMWHGGAPNYSAKKDRHLLVAHYTPNFVRLRMDLKKNTNKNIFNKDKKKGGILSQLLT
tara:strand:- start:24 stop:1286 length:1263 start_codon:yes stop_codon:yes gene_type:complete